MLDVGGGEGGGHALGGDRMDFAVRFAAHFHSLRTLLASDQLVECFVEACHGTPPVYRFTCFTGTKEYKSSDAAAHTHTCCVSWRMLTYDDVC